MEYQPNRKEHAPLEEDALDIKKYLFLILANWYWFVLSIFVCLFIAYLVNRYSEPIYSVSSSLIVRDDNDLKGYTGAENLIQGLKLIKNTKSVQNEIGILKSYSLANRAIKELGKDFAINYVAVGRRGIKESQLYKNSPFKVEIDSTIGIPYNLPIYINILSAKEYQLKIDGDTSINEKHRFGEWFRNHSFGFKVDLRKVKSFNDETIGRSYYFTHNALNDLTNTYISKVNITLNDKRGSILTLVSTGFVAEQEADYLNKLMEMYILSGLEDKNTIAENTFKFIDKQLIGVSDSLKRAEQDLENFRIKNKVIDLSAEGTMLFEKENELESQKASIELKRRYYNYLMDYIIKKSNITDIVAPTDLGVEDPQLAIILDQISQTYLQRKDLLLTTTLGSPSLTQIDNRLETLYKTLTEKVSSLIESNNLGSQDLKDRFLALDKEMLRIPTNQRMLINTQREFDLMNNLFIYLLQKRSDAGIAKASNIADNKILDYALPENSTMIKPKLKLNYMIGFALSVIIPLLIIILINYFNTKLTDIKEISGYTSAPIIGLIGHNSYDTEIPVALNPKSTLTESFRGLRTNLNYILREPDKKVVTVTSTISGEGKTFFAANLALIIAITGKKVLLVGLDLRKPKLTSLFGMSSQNGISTYLIGKDDFKSIIFQTQYDNLFLSPSGPIPPNPAELIGTTRMDDFIVEAKKQFDYIIIDTPPIAIVTDTLIVNRFTDALLFIVRFNYTNKEVLHLVENMRKSEANKNIALVVNDFIANQRYGYGYGYAYTYGYGYGSSYGNNNDKNGYYSDEEVPLTWRERIKKWLF